MKWLEKVIEEATRIFNHGEGKLELTAGPQGKDKTLILITAGKRYRFLIDRSLED